MSQWQDKFKCSCSKYVLHAAHRGGHRDSATKMTLMWIKYWIELIECQETRQWNKVWKKERHFV